MNTPVEVVQTDFQHVLCIQKTVRVEELPLVIGPAYGQIMGVMAKQGEQPSAAPYVAYFNLDMQALQVEIGFPVTRALQPEGEVEAGSMPAGKSLSTLYTGPYSEMKSAYDEMAQYAADHKLELTGAAYEYYLNGPETPPEQLQTRIVFPIK